MIVALGVACAVQTEEPAGYGEAPPLGTGATLGTTSGDDAVSSESTTSMGGSASVVTVTIGSSSATDGSSDTQSASTDTTSTSSSTGSTSEGSGGSSTTGTTSSSDVTTSSSGMASTTTSGGGASGTSGGNTSGGFGGSTSGGITSGGFGGSTSGGGVTTGGGSSTTFRYARLVALTSQNGNPYAAVAELQLLDANGQALNSSGWTASADSEETVDEVAPASQAIDGNTQTYWHTEWGDYEAPLPHYLQIDMGSAEEVTGFVYAPRQGGNDNGWILDWEFYLSNSASSPGTPVASGSFSSGTSAQTINLP